jgi:hypothetical protein
MQQRQARNAGLSRSAPARISISRLYDFQNAMFVC